MSPQAIASYNRLGWSEYSDIVVPCDDLFEVLRRGIEIMKITLIRNSCCGIAMGVKIINGTVATSLCDWISGDDYMNLCFQGSHPPAIGGSTDSIDLIVEKDGWYGIFGLLTTNTTLEWWEVPELLEDAKFFQ